MLKKPPRNAILAIVGKFGQFFWYGFLFMQKLIFLLVCCCIYIGTVLSGCAAATPGALTGQNVKNAGPPPIRIAAAEPKALPDYDIEDRNAKTSAVAAGANEFAFKLGSKLAANCHYESFACSPYSVWLPLAALAGATREKYAGTLLSALGVEGVDTADINAITSYMIYELTRQKYKDNADEHGNGNQSQMVISNAIFVRNDLTVKSAFAQLFMDCYKGNVINADFGSGDAIVAINQWAGERTGGLISDIVDGFDPDTVAAIVNAICYKGKWEREFDRGKTTEGVFHSPGNDENAYFMLLEGDNLPYYEDAKAQAMPLRINSGGGMFIFLPKSGDAAEFLSGMTYDYYKEITRGCTRESGKLLLPRFKIENDIKDLDVPLTGLGVPLFDAAAAPLTGGLIEEDLPVWLGAASQKVFIEADEEGLTAAAVTRITVAGAALIVPTEPFEMICDRPFAFVLYDNTRYAGTYDSGGQVLFTGVVNRP